MYIKKDGLSIKIVNDIPLEDFNTIQDMYINRNFNRLCDFIGEGFNGKVYGYKNYAIKAFIHSDNTQIVYPIFLEKLQKNKCFPKLYHYLSCSYMVYERIYGNKLLEMSNKKLKLNYKWKYILKDCIRYSLEQGVIPKDLNTENIIINKYGLPKIVDVGVFHF